MLSRRWTSLLALLVIGLSVAVLGCQTWTTSQTLPSGRYLQHPPQYMPPSPPFPLPRELAAQQAAAPLPTPTVRSASPLQPTTSVPLPPVPTASTAPTPVKLAVANVRGETALLFTMDATGKLTFVRKLPHGTAEDLATAQGQRWVAVFADNPASLQFTVPAGGQATWLLRPEPSQGARWDFWSSDSSHLTPERVHGGIQ
jgi:hypothetical protein